MFQVTSVIIIIMLA